MEERKQSAFLFQQSHIDNKENLEENTSKQLAETPFTNKGLLALMHACSKSPSRSSAGEEGEEAQWNPMDDSFQ